MGQQPGVPKSFLLCFPLPADAEVVVSAENKPLPVQDFAAPHLLHAEGTEPLPPGARRLGLGAKNRLGAELPLSPCPSDIPFSPFSPPRVAFLRWEFPNFSNRGKELLGRYAMARRHVQAAGFLLVDVSSHKRGRIGVLGAPPASLFLPEGG